MKIQFYMNEWMPHQIFGSTLGSPKFNMCYDNMISNDSINNFYHIQDHVASSFNPSSP